MDIYAQNILDRYKNPFHLNKEIEAGLRHKEANHSCGDSIEVSLRFDGETLAGYSFSGQGCAISMAAADMLGDLAEGMTKEEILKLGKKDIYEMLGIEISLRRSKCALLGLLTLQNTLAKKPRSWNEY